MSTKRRKYVLYLDSPQIEALREISKRTRIPASVIAREGIEFVVSKYSRKKVLDTTRRGK